MAELRLRLSDKETETLRAQAHARGKSLNRFVREELRHVTDGTGLSLVETARLWWGRANLQAAREEAARLEAYITKREARLTLIESTKTGRLIAPLVREEIEHDKASLAQLHKTIHDLELETQKLLTPIVAPAIFLATGLPQTPGGIAAALVLVIGAGATLTYIWMRRRATAQRVLQRARRRYDHIIHDAERPQEEVERVEKGIDAGAPKAKNALNAAPGPDFEGIIHEYHSSPEFLHDRIQAFLDVEPDALERLRQFSEDFKFEHIAEGDKEPSHVHIIVCTEDDLGLVPADLRRATMSERNRTLLSAIEEELAETVEVNTGTNGHKKTKPQVGGGL